jgi:LPXTG-site transpeptidase (sortase) family protein
MRDQVYNDMKIAMMDIADADNNIIAEDVPVAQNIDNNTSNETPPAPVKPVDWSKYLGVLEIPRIGLKRGFYGVGSRYNNIQYNVTMVNGTSLPDQVNGNTILMAHSGDAYISYFAYLYRLELGNLAYITYHGNQYTYQLVNRYDVPKIGVVSIKRDYNKTCLTLITCTKDNDSLQTVYVFEQV